MVEHRSYFEGALRLSASGVGLAGAQIGGVDGHAAAAGRAEVVRAIVRAAGRVAAAYDKTARGTSLYGLANGVLGATVRGALCRARRRAVAASRTEVAFPGLAVFVRLAMAADAGIVIACAQRQEQKDIS
jgi:hypothetical protein